MWEGLGFSWLRPYAALGATLAGVLLVRRLAETGRGLLRAAGQEGLLPGVLLLEVLGYLGVAALGLAALGYPPTALLAGGAVVGALVGLAAQTALANVFSGFLLLFSGAVRVGEGVRFHLGGVPHQGKVQEITLSHVRLQGPMGEVWVPNAALAGSSVFKGEVLGLEASLPSEAAWRALEEAFPGVRFVPSALGPGGLKGTLYLPREAVDPVLAFLQGITPG